MTESVFTSNSASVYTLQQSRLLMDPVDKVTFIDGVINSIPEFFLTLSQLVFFSVFVTSSDSGTMGRYCYDLILQYITPILVPLAIYAPGIRDAVNKHIQGQYNAAVVYALYSLLLSLALSFVAGVVLFALHSNSVFGRIIALLGFVQQFMLKQVILFNQYTGQRDYALSLGALAATAFSLFLLILQITAQLGETTVILAFTLPLTLVSVLGFYFNLPGQEHALAIDFRQFLPFRAKLFAYLLVTSYGDLAEAVALVISLALCLFQARRCAGCEGSVIALFYFLLMYKFGNVLKGAFRDFSFTFYNINYAAHRTDRLGLFEKKVFLPFYVVNVVYAVVWFLVAVPILKLLSADEMIAFLEPYQLYFKLAMIPSFIPGSMLNFNTFGMYKIVQSLASLLAVLAALCVFLQQFFSKAQGNPLEIAFCHLLVYEGSFTVFLRVLYRSTDYARRAAAYPDGADPNDQSDARALSQTSYQNHTSHYSYNSQINNSQFNTASAQNVQLSGIPALRASCSYANQSYRSETREAEKGASQSDIRL